MDEGGGLGDRVPLQGALTLDGHRHGLAHRYGLAIYLARHLYLPLSRRSATPLQCFDGQTRIQGQGLR